MSQTFQVEFCYYGARETLVTHIMNMRELASHLKKKPFEIKNYFAERLNTSAEIEGDTMKVKGLLKNPLIDMLVEEIKEDS